MRLQQAGTLDHMEVGPPSEFLELDEAAELLRTTPRTLRRWTAENKVPAVRLGRKPLYRRDVLMAIGKPEDSTD